MYKYNPLLSGKLDRVDTGVSKLGELDDVNTAGTVQGYVLTYGTTVDTWTPKSAGAGDMLKCYTPDTDILTKNGFKKITEVKEEEEVCTLNPNTFEIEYQNISHFFKYLYDGKLYHIESQQVDLIVTPNHKMYVKKRDDKNPHKFELIEAQEIAGKRVRYKKDGIWKGDDNDFTLPSTEFGAGWKGASCVDRTIPMRLWCEFMGYYLSEGCCGKYRSGKGRFDYITIISQRTSSHNFDRMLKCTSKVASHINRTQYINGDNIKVSSKPLYSYVQQFGKVYDKYVPNEIKNTTRDNIRVFLEAYVAGDGCVGVSCNRVTPKWTIFTTSKHMVSDLQELALKAGWAANIYIATPKGWISEIRGGEIHATTDCYGISINKRKLNPQVHHGHHKTQKGQREEWIDYNGYVYSIEVPKHHVIYVRRSGKTVWSGNSVYDTGDDGVVDNSERLEGETLATVQAHTVDAANISGTVADANIPDVETLSYSVPFADAQIPTLDATKIISGSFDAAQIPELPTSRIATGTFVADRIPTIENLKGTVPDGKIPDVESLSYSGAFAVAQIPNLSASKITSGTLGIARIPTMDDGHIPDLDTLSYGAAFAEGQIPNLPTTKITSGTLGLARIPSITNAYLAGDITSDKISALNGTALSYPLNADTVGTTAIKAAGVGNDELAASGLDISKCTVGTAGAARIPSLPAARITSGTFGLARIPSVDDARIPDVDTLSYGAAFAAGQIPNLAASKIASGTFALARIPAVDDARIPDLDTLSYSGAFAVAQIPNLAASKITTGSFNADRIPSLPTSRITSGTLGIARIPTMDDGHIPDLESLSYSGAFATGQIPNLPASKTTTGTFNANRIPVLPASRITTGTFNLNRIPSVDDARIPNIETLSYGAAFATAQIPAHGAYKITSGTLAVARHETLDNLNGTVALSQIPTMDDAHIPDLDTLSYAAAFGTAQVPPIGAYKTASGTLNADRIPSLPTARITTGTFNSARIPDVGVVAINYVIDGAGAAITAGTVGFLEVPFACHVDRWTLLADQHGSVVIDIWRDAYSNYPPTDADSMSGTTNMPAISGTVAAQGTDLSGWGTQGIASGDILAYHVDSCSSIELCTLALRVQKT